VPTNNSQNSTFSNAADGFSLAGGTTPRTLTLTAGNVTLSSGGANTYTMPAATDTLVGRASTDTLTNKTLTDPVINQFGTASGLGAAWDSWTPTATNFNTGTATLNYAQYKQIGKTVFFRVSYTLTGAAVTGSAPTFTLPVTSVSYTTFSIVGGSTLRDTGVSIYFGSTVIESTTTFGAYTNAIGGSFISPSVVSATSPFIWGNTDVLIMNGVYQAA